MTRTALSALLSHWRRHPLQLAMLLLGLALATALWSGVQAINAEARASYDEAAAVLGQDQLDRLVPLTGPDLAQADYIALRRAGWLVSPVIEGRLRLGGQPVTLLGIDPLTAPPQAGVGGFDGGAGLLPFVTPPGELLGSAATVAALHADDLPPGTRLRPVEGLPDGTLLADIGIAQTLLSAEGRVSRLLLHPDQPAGLPDWQATAPDLRLERPEQTADLAALTDSFHLNLTAFGLLSFAVGLFIVQAAVGLAFEQRRPMIRTLRALGLPAGRLMALLLGELVLLALIAGGIGLGLGYLVAAALLPDVAATLSGLYGATVPGVLSFRPGWAAAGLAMALAGTLVAAAQGLWRVWRLPLLAPAQPRAWARASERGLWLQGGAALILGLAAVALAQVGGGLTAGFAMLACLLLAAALALPVVLAATLALVQRRSRGVMAQWFLADTRQQLPGLSLALMALMLALATNIGVGTMVSSFRLTFTGWLDQRLPAELYVVARTEDEAVRLRTYLIPRADAVLPNWRVEGTIAGAPGTVYGLADHATYRDSWPLLSAAPDAWAQLAAGTGALVNEQLARREGLALGDPVALPDGLVLPLAGIYSDYGNPTGQAIIGVDLFVTRYPDAPRLAHAIRVAPDDAPALAAALVDDLGLPAERVQDQAAIKALSLRVFERTFAVSAALNVLTLGVAAVALLASLTTLSTMRLPQLAPAWAMGLTRARLARLELARTLMLAALTAVVALPVGLLLAWVLLAVVNVEAFGWRLPMHLFPADWALLGGFALVAALLAAALPVRRLARIPPATLLRVFANER
jgi:putative ABC transport system permease protein